MDRSPIYQTFSTRVLVRQKTRARRHVVVVAALLAALVACGVLLGHGAFAAKPSQAGTALPGHITGSGSSRGDLLSRLAEQPTAAPTATASPARLRVAGTEGLGLHLRAEPDRASTSRKILAEGEEVVTLGRDVDGPDRRWRFVRDSSGAEGWVADDYLQPL